MQHDIRVTIIDGNLISKLVEEWSKWSTFPHNHIYNTLRRIPHDLVLVMGDLWQSFPMSMKGLSCNESKLPEDVVQRQQTFTVGTNKSYRNQSGDGKFFANLWHDRILNRKTPILREFKVTSTVSVVVQGNEKRLLNYIVIYRLTPLIRFCLLIAKHCRVCLL